MRTELRVEVGIPGTDSRRIRGHHMQFSGRSSDSGGQGVSPRTEPSRALRLTSRAGFVATTKSRVLAESNFIGKFSLPHHEPACSR